MTHMQLAENVWGMPAEGRSPATSIPHNCGRAERYRHDRRLRWLAPIILRTPSPEDRRRRRRVAPDLRPALWRPLRPRLHLEQLGIDAIVRQQGPGRGISSLTSSAPCSPRSPTAPAPGLETLLP